MIVLSIKEHLLSLGVTASFVSFETKDSLQAASGSPLSPRKSSPLTPRECDSEKASLPFKIT